MELHIQIYKWLNKSMKSFLPGSMMGRLLHLSIFLHKLQELQIQEEKLHKLKTNLKIKSVNRKRFFGFLEKNNK